MDIEKLIEQLRDKGCEDCPHRDTCRDDDTAECVIRLNTATALSTLQAENEKLREKIEDARLEGYAKGLSEMSKKNEKLRAELYNLRPGFQNQKALIKQLRTELEQVKQERDAAVNCIKEIEDALNFQRISAISLRISEWRGQKED